MKITENVFMLEAAKRSRVFLVMGEKNAVIDTGMPGKADELLVEIEQLGVLPKTVGNILLTHHDVDHSGNVRKLQEATGATVWIGNEDEPYLMGKKNRPGVKRIIQSIVRVKAPVSCNTYDHINQIDGIRIISAPGHTPGHHIFQYGTVIFTGDLFKTPNGDFESMRPAMNWNQKQLQASISMLNNLSFDWVCTSHGLPVRNDEKLHNFLNTVSSY
jgi:glyoxylase-like metal-dependent hydrolase (beta-lactamase superfamily II)